MLLIKEDLFINPCRIMASRSKFRYYLVEAPVPPVVVSPADLVQSSPFAVQELVGADLELLRASLHFVAIGQQREVVDVQ